MNAHSLRASSLFKFLGTTICARKFSRNGNESASVEVVDVEAVDAAADSDCDGVTSLSDDTRGLPPFCRTLGRSVAGDKARARGLYDNGSALYEPNSAISLCNRR